MELWKLESQFLVQNYTKARLVYLHFKSPHLFYLFTHLKAQRHIQSSRQLSFSSLLLGVHRLARLSNGHCKARRADFWRQQIVSKARLDEDGHQTNGLLIFKSSAPYPFITLLPSPKPASSSSQGLLSTRLTCTAYLRTRLRWSC